MHNKPSSFFCSFSLTTSLHLFIVELLVHEITMRREIEENVFPTIPHSTFSGFNVTNIKLNFLVEDDKRRNVCVWFPALKSNKERHKGRYLQNVFIFVLKRIFYCRWKISGRGRCEKKNWLMPQRHVVQYPLQIVFPFRKHFLKTFMAFHWGILQLKALHWCSEVEKYFHSPHQTL